MSIVVLGGDGQVGAPLVRKLLEEGYEVTNYDIQKDWWTGDLRRPSADLHMDIALADFVFFLAFDVGGSTYLKEYQNTYEFLQNNVDIMNNVFYYLQQTSVPFIFTSSQMSNMNHSQYGVLKRLGEFYTDALAGINVRFWNVYGYETEPEKFHVITDFINMAKNDGVIKIRTTGDELRQFLHTDDSTEALIQLMLNFDLLNQGLYYDITSFKWTSVLDVANIIADYFGATVEKGWAIDNVQQGQVNIPEDRIKDLWIPKIDIKDGIERVIKDMECSE